MDSQQNKFSCSGSKLIGKKDLSATNLGYEIIIPNRVKLGRNNYSSLEGSGINIDMSSNPKELFERNRELHCELKSCTVLNNIYFSTSGVEEFQTIIKTRWEKLR